MGKRSVGAVEPGLADQLVENVGGNISDGIVVVALLLHESCKIEHFFQEIFAVNATTVLKKSIINALCDLRFKHSRKSLKNFKRVCLVHKNPKEGESLLTISTLDRF